MSTTITTNIRQTALFAAQCCHSSYNDLVDPIPEFERLGFHQTYFIGEYICPTKQWLPMNDEIECVAYFSINHETKTCVLTFRGTGSWNDLKDDLRFIKLRTENGWFVHRGFNDRYIALKNRVEQMIIANMPKYTPEPYRLIVTGHSLGHAMVVLFLLNASPELIERVTEVYTFGGPRVGGKKVAQYIDNLPCPFYRYTNRNDIITKIPLINYYHCGQQIKVNGDGWLSFIPCLYNHKIVTYLDILHGTNHLNEVVD